MPPQKTAALPSSDTPAKKARKTPVKVQAQTVIPEGHKVQVHERKSPPDNYPICNGTSFEPYRPKTWGR